LRQEILYLNFQAKKPTPSLFSFSSVVKAATNSCCLLLLLLLLLLPGRFALTTWLCREKESQSAVAAAAALSKEFNDKN
jgi:hypothetical protein